MDLIGLLVGVGVGIRKTTCNNTQQPTLSMLKMTSQINSTKTNIIKYLNQRFK